MRAVKALVLARGRGSRMRAGDPAAVLTGDQQAAAKAGWKALMPIAGRPFLDYLLSALADAGCVDVALVIGPDQRRDFETYATRRVRLHLVEQAEPRGTANAVWAAREWVGTDPFLVMNGDNLYPTPALRGLGALDGPGLPAFERDELIASSNIPPHKIAAFAILDVSPAGELISIVEKPPTVVERPGRPVLVSMNAWRFDARVLEACRDAPLSPRGEHEIASAVQLAIGRGVRFAAVPAVGPVLDLSGPSDVADVTRRLTGVEPRP